MGDLAGDVTLPAKLCRGCRQPVEKCVCDTVQCLWCVGEGLGSCPKCDGDGVMRPDAVGVIPDRDALAIREYLRESPELLRTQYGDSDDPLEGLCYPAAEAYYHVTGCEYDVYCLSWDEVDDDKEGTHWYLRDPGSREFIDLGLPFEAGIDLPPFEAGRHRGFMTGDTPSERTQVVLDSLGFKW